MTFTHTPVPTHTCTYMYIHEHNEDCMSTHTHKQSVPSSNVRNQVVLSHIVHGLPSTQEERELVCQFILRLYQPVCQLVVASDPG